MQIIIKKTLLQSLLYYNLYIGCSMLSGTLMAKWATDVIPCATESELFLFTLPQIQKGTLSFV